MNTSLRFVQGLVVATIVLLGLEFGIKVTGNKPAQLLTLVTYGSICASVGAVATHFVDDNN